MKIVKNIDKIVLLIVSLLWSGKGFSSEPFRTATEQGSDTLRERIELYFRFDRSVLEREYMGNAASLATLEQLLTPDRSGQTDSIKIEAYASPEGNAEYNRQLSQRRGAEVKKVLLWKFPYLAATRIHYRGMGENWDGLHHRVLMDSSVPQRSSVLDILSRYSSPIQREKRLKALNGGQTYEYLLHRHFRYLRSGSSVFITLFPKVPFVRTMPTPIPLRDTVLVFPIGMNSLERVPAERWRYYRPLAIKTNLLFDVLSVLNVELEIPIGKRVSVLAEWTFPWWGGVKYPGDHTVQLLSGGLEARYWFPQSKRMQESNRRWPGYNPLTGWFVGLYGGVGKYDVQLGGDGLQGEFGLSMGVSGGFAHPIGRHLHMEYSLGVGYFKSEYRYYVPMDNHKVWQHDARQSWLGPTKAKVSLVWIPQFKIKEPSKRIAR